jgi:V/A-type H+-transporting ATPase subunit F
LGEKIEEVNNMSTKPKSQSAGSIAVIGERELIIGYRLLGINETFLVSKGEDSYKTMEKVFSSNKFAMIIASDFVRDSLPQVFKSRVEGSINPLVIFMPSLRGDIHEESIASLARRVLGINV